MNNAWEDFKTTVLIPTLIALIGVPPTIIVALESGEKVAWMGPIGVVYAAFAVGMVRFLETMRKAGEA